jgi:hypothetical protein
MYGFTYLGDRDSPIRGFEVLTCPTKTDPHIKLE